MLTLALTLSLAAEYPTPFEQKTQSTYVPQSVALSGPKRLPYREDMAPPAGYTVVTEPRRGLIGGGIAMLGGAYLASVVGAAIDIDFKRCSSGCTNEQPAYFLFLPVVGPLIELRQTTQSATGSLFLVLDSLIQGGGLVMAILGLKVLRPVYVRNDLAPITIQPTLGPTGGGMKMQF